MNSVNQCAEAIAHEPAEELLAQLQASMFDPATAAKKVVLDADIDQLSASAVNFYRDVTAAEGISMRQGGHQIAQKPVNTTWPLSDESDSLLPSIKCKSKSLISSLLQIFRS